MIRTLKLDKRVSIEIKPKAPFNFDATLHKPSYFPTADDSYEKGIYWITMVWQGKYLGLKFENKGTVDKPKIKLIVYSKTALSKKYKKELIQEIEWRSNLKSDISKFCKEFKKDKMLSPLLKKWRGMRPATFHSLYENLVIYIILQNTVVRRSVQMMENLFNRFGKKLKFNGKTLSASWKPEAIDKVSEQTLRDLKLGYRAKFLKKISSQFAKGKIDEFKMRKMNKDELKKEALKLYGIGPASADYLLFEDFYHYDAFDTVSPWEQKILSRLIYNKPLVPAKKILLDTEKRWGKWKRLAIHYIWEDIFWQRKQGKKIEWLEKEIRL